MLGWANVENKRHRWLVREVVVALVVAQAEPMVGADAMTTRV